MGGEQLYRVTENATQILFFFLDILSTQAEEPEVM